MTAPATYTREQMVREVTRLSRQLHDYCTNGAQGMADMAVVETVEYLDAILRQAAAEPTPPPVGRCGTCRHFRCGFVFEGTPMVECAMWRGSAGYSDSPQRKLPLDGSGYCHLWEAK